MKRITPVTEYDFLSSSPDASLLVPIKNPPIRKLIQPSIMKLIEPSIMKLVEIDDGKEGNIGMHIYI